MFSIIERIALDHIHYDNFNQESKEELNLIINSINNKVYSCPVRLERAVCLAYTLREYAKLHQKLHSLQKDDEIINYIKKEIAVGCLGLIMTSSGSGLSMPTNDCDELLISSEWEHFCPYLTAYFFISSLNPAEESFVMKTFDIDNDPTSFLPKEMAKSRIINWMCMTQPDKRILETLDEKKKLQMYIMGRMVFYKIDQREDVDLLVLDYEDFYQIMSADNSNDLLYWFEHNGLRLEENIKELGYTWCYVFETMNEGKPKHPCIYFFFGRDIEKHAVREWIKEPMKTAPKGTDYIFHDKSISFFDLTQFYTPDERRLYQHDVFTVWEKDNEEDFSYQWKHIRHLEDEKSEKIKQVSKPNSRNKPSTSGILSFAIDISKSQAIIEKIQKYQLGKNTPKDLAMPIRAAIDAGVIRRPSAEDYSACEYFAEIKKSSLNNYTNPINNPYSDIVFDNIVEDFMSLL